MIRLALDVCAEEVLESSEILRKNPADSKSPVLRYMVAEPVTALEPVN